MSDGMNDLLTGYWLTENKYEGSMSVRNVGVHDVTPHKTAIRNERTNELTN